MKVTFIYPRFQKFLDSHPDLRKDLPQYFLGSFTTPPSLGIPILASWTPPDIEVEFVDDNSGDALNPEAETDLVAINCFTPQGERAFEIADLYRKHGRKVVMGGLFPSFRVEECLQHADAVNVGEGEPTWPQILADARSGKLQPVYRGGCSFDLAQMRPARREIFYRKKSYDWDEDLVQLTRGCVYQCAMCAIPAHMGSRLRFRPVAQVVEEIRGLKFENVYLADDTLFFQQRKILDYSKALFAALAPLGKKYFVSSTMALNTDPAFLDLAAAAGVRNFYCTMNVDPVSIKAIEGGKKEREQLRDLVKMLEDRDIRFFASYGIGRDWDDEHTADRMLEMSEFAGIHTAEFFVFTPYPGSVQWDRLERQGRILDRRWSRYNGAHVVFQPERMSPEKLFEQFMHVWKGFYSRQTGRHMAHLEPSTWKDGVQTVGKPLERQGAREEAVITGIGVLSPIGNRPADVLASLREARHGLAAITQFDASHFRTRLGGEIRGFDPLKSLTEPEVREYEDRYLIHAIAAARAALSAAGLDATCAGLRTDVALVLGTCNGGLRSAEEEYRWLQGKSDRPFDEGMNLRAQYYGFGKALARALGLGGETWIVTTACSSTTAALGLAQMLIRNRRCGRALVGGSDSLCISNLSGFDGLKATSTGRTAPFSAPPGLNTGEAACFWVVESMDQALLRNAPCLGRILGHATTCDAYHPTTPDPRGDGVFRTLRNALADAGLDAADLGCVNAHGTGTEANDSAESRGIGRFLDGAPVPAVSLKSFFGHCMGTTGLLEATANLLAMNDGFIPPTLNFTTPRPGCALDYVPNTPRRKAYRAFISANYAFGGNNAAVVIGAADRPASPRAHADERVVVTGAGAVSAFGLGLAPLLDGLFAGQTGFSDIARLGIQDTRARLAGLVPDWAPSAVDRRLDLSDMNRISRFATVAGKLALDSAALRVSPRNAENAGIVLGVSNGPPESDHMNSVFATPDHRADIKNFSNIVANSTTGWVANALCLKGVNLTLAPGPHAGLQCLAFAWESLKDGRAEIMLAGGADEIYPQMYRNYDRIGFLFQDDEEADYRIRLGTARRKLIGEGAAFLALETLRGARERNARPLAEILGYGMSMDADEFSNQCLAPEGLIRACEIAMTRSGVDAKDIDAIVWAPQGNVQDRKVLQALEHAIGPRAGVIPFIATSMNTGAIETASVVMALAALLEAIRANKGIWPQRTGLPDMDARPVGRLERVLAMGSTDLGYNFAVILNTGAIS